MIIPYADFLHQVPDFEDGVTVTAIRKQFPAGDGRVAAFAKAKEQFPDRADIAFEHVSCLSRQGLYGVDDIEAALDLVALALRRPPKGKSHDKLKKLETRLIEQRTEWLAEVGPEAEAEPNLDTVHGLIRAGRVDDAIARFEYLRANVTPRGIAYSDEDEQRQYWGGFESMGEYFLDKLMPEKALPILNEYFEKSISVKLTPIPGYGLQEKIIGYLAQVDMQAARDMLTMWMDNSRNPYITDVIKHHPDLKASCAKAL